LIATDCGAFGVSSDEYLNYALTNRNEWQQRGQEVVEEMKARAIAKYSTELHFEEQNPMLEIGNSSNGSTIVSI